MKSIALCSPELISHSVCEYAVNLNIYGQTLNIGLLNISGLTSDPNIPDEGVLVKVKAFSCNYRDKSFILSEYRNKIARNTSGKLLYSPFGSEFVGEVIKTGKSVTTLKPGDRVIPDGAYPLKQNGEFGGLPTNYASQALQIFHWSYLLKIPSDLSDEKAAGFTIAGQTVYSMIRRLQLNQGENVLVTAATSNTSLAAITALRQHDVNVYACSTSEKYKKELSELGVRQILPAAALDEKQLPNSLVFDAVIDPFEDLYCEKVLRHLNIGARYITCGCYQQHPLFAKQTVTSKFTAETLGQCIVRNISLIGNCLGTPQDLQNALKDYSAGKFDIKIDSVWSGKELQPFLNKTFHNQERLGKVIYKYTD